MEITLNPGECPLCLGTGFSWIAGFKCNGSVNLRHTQSQCTMCGGTGKLPVPILKIEIPLTTFCLEERSEQKR